MHQRKHQRKYRVYSIEYRVKKEKKRYKKVVFFFLSNCPTKVYNNGFKITFTLILKNDKL